MEENLKTARTTHQVLLGLSGIYLLGRLAFESGGDMLSGVNFLGFEMANEAAFTLVLGGAFLLTALRLCVFLGHIRRLPKSDEDVSLVKTFPWVLLFDGERKLANVLSWIETLAMLGVGSEIGRILCRATPWLGAPYIVILIGLFVYGLLQLHHIRGEARLWERR